MQSSIPRFSAEWVGYQQNSGLHHFQKFPDKKNPGEAIEAHFDNLIPACLTFLGWLDRLFSVTIQA
jgi:hypothetical protein